MNAPDSIVIVSATRTATGRFNGQFKSVPATKLGAITIQSALEKAALKADQINEVYMGCVLPAALGQAPARQAALAAGLSQHTPCTTINKVCGSGMKAVMLAFDQLLINPEQLIIAGGMENMTRAPYLLTKARFGYRLGKGEILDHMMHDGLEDAYDDTEKPMGYFAEQCANKYHFSRAAQDQYALASLQRAQTAQRCGAFRDEITPVPITADTGEIISITEDEGPQKVDPAKIPTLKPAFVKDGTITAANSSSIADGAAALLLMHASTAQQLKIKPLAKIIGHYTVAQKPAWFTTAPVGAIQGLLKKIKWNKNHVDLFEINEAFAVVVMAAMKELDLPQEKVNVHGGASVLGHPIGASGARILVTLIYALRQKNLTRGIASLCIGGGEATAIAIERLS